MASRNGREALREAEEETFDLLDEVSSSKQRAELLKAQLERAAAEGNRLLAQKLVGAGAEIGEALHYAVRGGNEDLVNDLLEAGAPAFLEDTGVWTPLHFAAHGGKTEIVQLLLLKGANKDAYHDTRTPLYLAVCEGHVSAALALLAAGADVSPRCSVFKRSVVHEAAQGDHVEILRAVIEHGADLEAADEPNKCTAMHVATVFDAVESINVLVEAGANIGAHTYSRGTPLHYAATHRHPKAMSALLNSGANIDAQNEHEQTPLHLAALEAGGLQGAAEVVDLLLRSGADETILDDAGKAAADVVGEIGTFLLEQYGHPAEDVDPVRRLLANAPADRAWRRRGYLVLCRAYPDRAQLAKETSNPPSGVARRTCSAGKLARTEAHVCTGTAGGSTADARACGDWVGVMTRVLGLLEEGIFRTIVGHL